MELKNLSKNLNKLIQDARISTRVLEEKLNIPIATIKKIRYGDNLNPTISTLLPLANYFGVTINQLIGEDELPRSALKIESSGNIALESVSVPILDWEDLNENSSSKSILPKKYVITEFTTSNNLFALTVDVDDYTKFERSGILIIDPNRKYTNKNYVIVFKHGQTRPTIKQIIVDDGTVYLHSLINNISSTTPLTSEFTIIGVIISYKKSLV